ncbi:ribosome silencing factor [Euzebya sp.]|uniref:ribosome silencing factor n=1 Tax=Euzebya sp. TaxID=1971409 RepID=UPI00351759D0
MDLAQIRQQVMTGASAVSAKKATDVVVLEVGPLLGITDFFLLLSTANARQLKAAVEEAEHQLRTTHGRRPIGREGSPEAGWIVLDYGDFVIHAFTAVQREVYGLERLWSDAVRTEVDEAVEAR